jgi:branched-chain amino acid transport system permease protein
MKNKELRIKKTTKENLFTFALCFLFWIIVTVMNNMGILSRHAKSLLVPICVNAVLAVSLNLVIGFLGELSLGHAGFMSVGAYASCLFSINFLDKIPRAVRFPLAVLIGGIAGLIFGILVGVPVLRLKGDYLAIVTLAFGEILRSVIINLKFTGGASGLKGMPQDSSFNRGFITLCITLFVVVNLIDSKHGRAIMALRDNGIAAESVGINSNKYKVLVFAVSAFFAGMAGALYGHNYSILSAGSFDYNKSIEILVMVVLGGIGSIRGSIVAATLITVLPEMLRGLNDYRMLIYSLVLIAMMLAGANPAIAKLKANISSKNLFKNKKETKNG